MSEEERKKELEDKAEKIERHERADATISQDPLAGKSIDELKDMIEELQKNQTENTRKIRAFAVSLQTVSFKLKELGIDMGVIGRNVDQTLDAIVNNKLPQNVADQLT